MKKVEKELLHTVSLLNSNFPARTQVAIYSETGYGIHASKLSIKKLAEIFPEKFKTYDSGEIIQLELVNQSMLSYELSRLPTEDREISNIVRLNTVKEIDLYYATVQANLVYI